MFNLGIDASRCKSGGAYAHLHGILNNLDLNKHTINHIHIWSHDKMLENLPKQYGVSFHSSFFLNNGVFLSLFWQLFILPFELKRHKCRLLFTADSSTICQFYPQVVLNQDILAFEREIVSEYGFGLSRLRLFLIKLIQRFSLRNACGVIFLTNYASNLIQNSIGSLPRFEIIGHGVDDIYLNHKTPSEKNISNDGVFNLIYISNFDFYKNQLNVVRAINNLRNKGFLVNLKLVGGGVNRSAKILHDEIKLVDPDTKFIFTYNFLTSSELIKLLDESDIFIFASSCEAFGITLLEGMVLGLPIACSKMSCMPELLGPGGLYFDPKNIKEIEEVIEQLIQDKNLRIDLGVLAKKAGEMYTWRQTSDFTFKFITKIYNETI